jgi:hypothetical protein
MTERAVLLKEIDTLPLEYLVSVHKVGYFMDRTLHLLPFRTETVRKMRFIRMSVYNASTL